MESVFTSLSKRQTMLLLTGVTFGGHDCMEAFDFLVGYEADLLKHRAQELMRIPREKRIPLLVQEIKRIVTSRSSELNSADPESLAQVLSQERAGTRELVLRAFPEAVAQAVRQYLPPPPKGWKPPKRLRPEVVAILRWRLEEALRAEGAKVHFKFSDVLLLQTRELLTLCDHFGARALGPSIAGLVQADRDAFMAKLPPDLLMLCTKAAEAASARKLTDRDAEEVLELHGAPASPSEAVRSAGAQKLVRACLAQSAEFAARLVERQRGEFGALLVKWVREERAKAVSRGDGGRTEFVQEMANLEVAGLITKPARAPSSGAKSRHHRRGSKAAPAAPHRPPIEKRPSAALFPDPPGANVAGVVRAPLMLGPGELDAKPPSKSMKALGEPPRTDAKPPSKAVQPVDPPRTDAKPPSASLFSAGARPSSQHRPGPASSGEKAPPPGEKTPPSGLRAGALGGSRPPSDKVPLAAMARGDSASAKFRAAAESAAPKPRSSLLGEDLEAKSSSWNKPRPATPVADPDPSITLPPHRVKKGTAKPDRTDEVTDPGSGGGPGPKTGPKQKKD